MDGVLHLIDAETSADALRQLAAVIGPDDVVASLGPLIAPAWWDRPIRRLRKPLGSAALGGILAKDLPANTELLHAWSIPAAQAGEPIARKRGCPTVLSLPYFPPTNSLDRLGLLTSSGKVALTAPTEACRRRLLEAGVGRSGVHVFPPVAATIPRREELRTKMRKALGVVEAHRLIAAPGRFTRQAGHKYACWVFSVLRQILDDVRLLLPGDGPAWSAVHTFAATLGYDREIFMTVERLTIQEVLAAADLAVFPANGDCDVGPLVSAMAAGLPVAAWSTADVTELTGSGLAAMLCPVGDVRSASAAVLRLLQDPSAAAALSAVAADWAGRRFSAAAGRKRLLEIYAAPFTGSA